MRDHRCTNRCSHRATADSLRGLGFDLPELARDAHPMDKWNHEKLVQLAKHEATVAGLLQTCTRTGR